MASDRGQSSNVFISFARADAKFADQLRDELQRRGLTILQLSDAARAGEDLSAALARMIEHADVCLVVVSAASDPSTPWLSREWSTIQEVSWRRDDLVVCTVQLGDVELPPFLRQRQSLRLAKELHGAVRDAGSQIMELIGRAASTPKIALTAEDRSAAAERFAQLRRAIQAMREAEEANLGNKSAG